MYRKICVRCKEEFEAKRKDTIYCSECKKKKRVEWTMKSRKKRIPSTEIGVGSGNSSSNKKGIENHNTTTGIMLYRDMVNRDCCEKCGSTEHLCVHHIDHNRKHNEPSNLQVLCKKCHQAHHCVRDELGRFKKHGE